MGMGMARCLCGNISCDACRTATLTGLSSRSQRTNTSPRQPTHTPPHHWADAASRFKLHG
jgi:hypothetical protein